MIFQQTTRERAATDTPAHAQVMFTLIYTDFDRSPEHSSTRKDPEETTTSVHFSVQAERTK